jgi:hypothetical protein
MNSTTVSEKAGASLIALTRIVREGYGTGAWHGPDMKAALSEVTKEVAFWRPALQRHNIAEIALHHAYCVHAVRTKLAGKAPGPFALEGDDWFEATGREPMTWPKILDLVRAEQEQLAALVEEIAQGTRRPAVPGDECLDLVLGITCHAVYHAGQVQLLKRLNEAR